jgi:hypothetical protein
VLSFSFKVLSKLFHFVYGFTMIYRILFFVFVNIFDDAIRVLITFFSTFWTRMHKTNDKTAIKRQNSVYKFQWTWKKCNKNSNRIVKNVNKNKKKYTINHRKAVNEMKKFRQNNTVIRSCTFLNRFKPISETFKNPTLIVPMLDKYNWYLIYIFMFFLP